MAVCGKRRPRLRYVHDLVVVEQPTAPLYHAAVLPGAVECIELGDVRQGRTPWVLRPGCDSKLFRDAIGGFTRGGVEVEGGENLKVRIALASGARRGLGDVHRTAPSAARCETLGRTMEKTLDLETAPTVASKASTCVPLFLGLSPLSIAHSR